MRHPEASMCHPEASMCHPEASMCHPEALPKDIVLLVFIPFTSFRVTLVFLFHVGLF